MAHQYCLLLPPRTVTPEGRATQSSCPAMPKKPVKKQTALPLFDDLDDEPQIAPAAPNFVKLVGGPKEETGSFAERIRPDVSSGEKTKARDILAAIKTLHQVEQRGTPATPEERDALARFCGFGPVALSIFPNPATGEFKDGWREIGEELKSLLTPQEYDSAKRTTFSQFFTSPGR